MRCARCEELQRQLAAAREEVAAWVAYAQDERRVDADEDRLATWRTVYGRQGIGPVMVLIALADRPDRLLGELAVKAMTRRPGMRQAEDLGSNVVTVWICRVRRVLRALAAEGRLPERFGDKAAGVKCHWRQGWSMAAEDAAVIRALVGEA